jgi:dihydrofolate synthase / folylpolyglutamate synthase
VDSIIVTNPTSAPPARGWDASEAAAFGAENGWNVELIPDLPSAVALAAAEGATVVITGSFHTVGDASICDVVH